ncbi:hypothetical protein [Metabacillus sp. Hm71]|uniref:hypothetical protein n=1 Tax=Metabacillus sp. Hm71 TaxID=3450743 RepID=UPI003F420E89
MIRKGKYVLYNGEEYKFTNLNSHLNSIELVSNKPNDLNKGFNLYAENVFVKTVSLNDIEKLFYVYLYVRYKGKEFPASDGKDGTILLDTSDAEIAKELDFEQTDKYQYSKYVPFQEVDIFEKIEPYNI